MQTRKPRFLTKSRFKIGHSCPTKLFYQDNDEYGNNNADNSFLKALADGGFQVGELAKIYYPGGTEVKTQDKDKAVQETLELMNNESAIIYEGAFRFENLFIRADLIIKRGKTIELIEVKAKSYNSDEDNFYNQKDLKKGLNTIVSSWEEYLVDVAFQKHVLAKIFPNYTIAGSLMLANKKAIATVNGLNQLFFLDKLPNGRSFVTVKPGTTKESLGSQLLIKVVVDSEIEVIWNRISEDGKTFQAQVTELSKICAENIKAEPKINSGCKKCEFRINQKEKEAGKKSGFDECWVSTVGEKALKNDEPLVFDVWNFRGGQKLMDSGIYLAKDIAEEDISPKPNKEKAGLSSSERQWLQIEKIKAKEKSEYIDLADLSAELKSWKYPLHFIDFETTMAAIPFYEGYKPYEQTAFQFSHHMVTADGVITHQSEYINTKKGHFPNFDFVRALKASLGNDEGSIFRFAAHENTVLSQIRVQLQKSTEVDKTDLIKFIESITKSSDDSTEKWKGKRSMIDLCELVKSYYYHPAMKNSNSIKKVLPAILNESKYLQEKYSKAIYGSKNGIKSTNFFDWSWIQFNKDGSVKDPYKLLPEVFNDLDLEVMESRITDSSLADGGAAMTAYARMQFSEMSDLETDRVSKALLKYCELDTLAMVMIWEHWKYKIETATRKKAA